VLSELSVADATIEAISTTTNIIARADDKITSMRFFDDLLSIELLLCYLKNIIFK
jgi:hypothetical protein